MQEIFRYIVSKDFMRHVSIIFKLHFRMFCKSYDLCFVHIILLCQVFQALLMWEFLRIVNFIKSEKQEPVFGQLSSLIL